MDPFSKYLAITGALRNATCELELLTRLTKADGSTSEVSHVRRAVCKKAMRRGNKTILTFADVDRSALDNVFPFETYTVADWPELFVDHVGRRVGQGVGTSIRVPLTWISKSGGVWKYGVCKNFGAPVVNAVYRGNGGDQTRLVDPTEYTISAAVGALGTNVVTANFTKEQLDFGGRPHVLEADVTIAGVATFANARTPANEIARILGLYGLTYDAASFTAADAADAAAGILIDSFYGGDKGRTGTAILADLLWIARAWLTQSSTGAWVMVQDVARASTYQFDTIADQVEVVQYGDGDIKKTVALDYKPSSGVAEDFTATLSRTTTGATGEQRFKNPYVRQHSVADKLVCYWQKRLNTLREGEALLHAAQVNNGDVATIADTVAWLGSKDFIVTGVTRQADRNHVNLREYDGAVYVYTASANLPADPTNVYVPDFSNTNPAAPASITVTQTQTFELNVTWAKVADVAGASPIRQYVVEESVGGGGFAEVQRNDSLSFKRVGVATGTSYQYRVKSVDSQTPAHESAYTTSGSFTPQKKIDDTYVATNSLTGGSIANGSINQGRSYTGTGGGSMSLSAGPHGNGQANMDVYTFFPGLDKGNSAANDVDVQVAGSKAGAADYAVLALQNHDTSTTVSVGVGWRSFLV